MVWSRSDLTGEQGFKPVLQTFVTRPVELVHLTYRRATGRAHGSAFRGAKAEKSGDGDADPDSKLVGTPNHPFWSVTRQAWVEIGRLQPGERLLLSDGREAVVETLEREYAPAVFENWKPGQSATGTLGTPADPATGTFTTYNFEVADWHTYFAGQVWVHNTGKLCDEGLDHLAEIYRRHPGAVKKMNLSPEELTEIQRRAGPVRPGDTGSYGDLKERKKAFGQTEPVAMDHQPSFAAQKKAVEQELGVKLTPAEARQLKLNTPAVASPVPIHQQKSPTYGGRNSPDRIAEDAASLPAAAARDYRAFKDAMRNR